MKKLTFLLSVFLAACTTSPKQLARQPNVYLHIPCNFNQTFQLTKDFFTATDPIQSSDETAGTLVTAPVTLSNKQLKYISTCKTCQHAQSYWTATLKPVTQNQTEVLLRLFMTQDGKELISNHKAESYALQDIKKACKTALKQQKRETEALARQQYLEEEAKKYRFMTSCYLRGYPNESRCDTWKTAR